MLVHDRREADDLAHEIATMPLSSWDGDARGALEAINAANGTRHFAKPADPRPTGIAYTTRNRQWRLDGTVDASLDAGSDWVTGTDGWRLSADTVLNQQKATVTPISFTSGNVTVWQAATDALPFTISADWETWVEFDDYVASPSADVNYTGDAVTATLTPFGHSAKLVLSTAGTSTITSLSIEGSLARRGVDESVVVDDTTSQAAPRGVRSGSEISGDFVGVIANAQGIAAHMVWRYATPQFRPTLTVVNWLPYQFEIDLYDVIAVTIAELGMTDRLFEVVGLTHECSFAPSADANSHMATYVLQESRVQTDPGWFVLDTSQLDGADVLAY